MFCAWPVWLFVRIVYKLCIYSRADKKPGICGRSACNALAPLLQAENATGAGADLVTLSPTFLPFCLTFEVLPVLVLARLFFKFTINLFPVAPATLCVICLLAFGGGPS